MRCGVWVVYRCQTPTTISWEDDLELNATGADGVGAAGALEGPGGGVATGAGETWKARLQLSGVNGRVGRLRFSSQLPSLDSMLRFPLFDDAS
jgi:hypothetical protein